MTDGLPQSPCQIYLPTTVSQHNLSLSLKNPQLRVEMPAVPVPGSVLRGWSFRQSPGKTGDEEPRLNDGLHDESRASFDKADTLPTKQSTKKMNSTNRENFKFRFQTMRQNKSYTVPSRRSEVVSGPRICQSFSNDENTESCMIEKGLNKYNRHALSKDSKGTQDISYSSNQPTIALFGASGVTGGHFLTAALDAGYNVRCLQVDDPREAHLQSDWATVKLGLEDDEQIRATVTAADYVVIMLGDVLPGKQEYPSGFLLSFVERLYDILREEESVQVVLFQVSPFSFVVDVCHVHEILVHSPNINQINTGYLSGNGRKRSCSYPVKGDQNNGPTT